MSGRATVVRRLINGAHFYLERKTRGDLILFGWTVTPSRAYVFPSKSAAERAVFGDVEYVAFREIA